MTFSARLRLRFELEAVFLNFSCCLSPFLNPFTLFRDGFRPGTCDLEDFALDFRLDIDVGCTRILALLL